MAPKATIQVAKTSSLTAKHTGKDSARKTVPKPPLGIPERLKRLFGSLCAQIDGGHFNNAIKTCDKILRLEPNDADAVQTKLFLLLQTEQYHPALTLIEGQGKNEDRAFERSYSLYRLHREGEARQILTSIKDAGGEDDRGVVHLDAQLCYREGSYQEAVELYHQLLDSAEAGSEEHADILTNLQASQKHVDFFETGYLQALDTLPSPLTKNIQSNPPPAQSSTQLAATLASRSVSEPTKPAEKKTRMSRVPAGVTPGVTPPPDPERWLKKSERSTFNQGKRRKGPGGGGGATQGSANVEIIAPSAGGTPSHGTRSGGKRKQRK